MSVEHAWAAGFVDGEGHFRLHLNKRLRTCATALMVTNRDDRPLRRLLTLYGGHVALRSTDHPNHSPMWDWQLTGRENLIAAVEAMRPYLVVKAAHAGVLLEYLYGTESGKGIRLTESERVRRVALAGQMAALNRRGPLLEEAA
jgi:hypothetical protein